jgi:hypothetical protein
MPTKREKIETNRVSYPGKIMSMPEGLLYYNASGTPCDASWGPCCCGAWHYGEMLPEEEDPDEDLDEEDLAALWDYIILGED